jgi:hypothetical protein
VSLPTLSKPTFEARLRALGVPEGVEIVAAGGDADDLHQVLYRDEDGQVHCVGRCPGIFLIDPSGKGPLRWRSRAEGDSHSSPIG